jgi:hypothetical protein
MGAAGSVAEVDVRIILYRAIHTSVCAAPDLLSVPLWDKTR